MFTFFAGLAIGAAFAPFWMAIWTGFVKPAIEKVVAKNQSSTKK